MTWQNIINIDSNIGLLPFKHQAIIWTNVALYLFFILPFLKKFQQNSSQKWKIFMCLQTSSAKWQRFWTISSWPLWVEYFHVYLSLMCKPHLQTFLFISQSWYLFLNIYVYHIHQSHVIISFFFVIHASIAILQSHNARVFALSIVEFQRYYCG